MRLPALLLLLITATTITNVHAQTQPQHSYIVLADSSGNNEKMLEGIVTKHDLADDTAFHWYAESRKIYDYPDSSAVAAFSNHKDNISFIIFFGTWCEDSQFILPKFYKIQEGAGFPEDRITAIAVDRHRNTIGNIAQVMHVTKTPTIIVLENGKEKGRLEEYGKTGYWDKELAEIINN
ncbi:MAG TPA: thioredoxin family protein [Chitinophagaceae bacterium]|nr:thioredoxin family protein [Chitinophagaceae bacterium]